VDIKNQIIAWATNHNLTWLISFHNNVRTLLKNQLKDLEGNKTKAIDNRIARDALYDYDRLLHINTFLMMYSYLEEWLYHYWHSYVPHAKLEDREGSLGRFKNVAQLLGIDLCSKLWQELRNAEELRNCLLHANGRISLLKNPNKIKSVIESKNSGLEIMNDRVVISGMYLQRFNENISELFDIMNKKSGQQQP